MKLSQLIFKTLKLFIIGIFIVIVLGLIGYVLYIANIFIGIAFMIVLALLTGYFGVRIKMALDKRKRESNIDEKIEKQKFHMQTADVGRKPIDLSAKVPNKVSKGKKVVKKTKKKK